MPAKGEFVALQGMTNDQYNHHIGKVDHIREDGRVILQLHPGEIQLSRRNTTTSESEAKSIAVLPEKIRPVMLTTVAGEVVSLWDGHSRLMVQGLFGERGKGLPNDIADCIADFFEIKSVVEDDVVVARASSSRGDYPLSVVLDDDDGWWISSPGSMQYGHGEEWLQVDFSGEEHTPRRVTAIGVRIPPLPMGPLSVRRFHLCSHQGATRQEWSLQTLDSSRLQWISLKPPLEVESVRVVMTCNAAAESPVEQGDLFSSSFHCVGLFQLAFR